MIQQYMVARGAAHQLWADGVKGKADTAIRDQEHISDLRVKLLQENHDLAEAKSLTVTGTLYPCALLSSGWWERNTRASSKRLKWRDGVQEWLFSGFDLWGPSWDFTWDLENWEKKSERRYFIAQLGDGDEANSLPVLIPGEKARRLQEYFREQHWGGTQAAVSGLLGGRRHFAGAVEAGALELFGGLLDYCLWLDADNPQHCVEPLAEETRVYSGYLWKCLAPKAWLKGGQKPCVNDVYFVWEHTNFANADAVAYALDALELKEKYLARKHGELLLVQKSSALVPGKENWPNEEIYALLLGKRGPRI